jgi:hypothetical protein
MKKLILTFTAIFYSIIIFAATITWNGTNGNWNTAANWSTGTVPTANDDVVISAGTANIWVGTLANAKSVDISSNGNLNIRVGASLTIIGSIKGFAFRNNNKAIISGLLTLTDNNDIPSFGLQNYDTLDIRLTGEVIVDGYHYSFDNWGYTINQGEMTLLNPSSTGIQQYLAGILNNDQSGVISIECARTGIYNRSNSSFTNHGELSIISCSNNSANPVGIYSKASFTNSVTGSIYLSKSGEFENYGVSQYETGTFTNSGEMVIEASRCLYLSNGIQNPGPSFRNEALGTVQLTTDLYGIQLNAITSFSNFGSISIDAGTNSAISCTSTAFTNNICAELVVEGTIYNGVGAIIQNNGAWFASNTIGSFNAGSFQNSGVLEDNDAGLYPIITNNRLVVRSITGPLVAGVPVNNLLDVSSWGTLQSLGIYTDALATNSAGTYVQTTNTFTPDAAAVGLPSLYIKIRRGNNGCTEIFRIDVLNPVPIVMPSGGTNALANSDQFQADFSVFPNPTTGRFSLQGKAANGPVEVLVADAFGRVVLRQHIDFQEIETYQFEAGQLLGAGLYFLKIMQNGAPIWQEKLLVTNH